MKNKDLLTFLCLSFAIGWFFMTLVVVYGIHSKAQLWLLPAMWAPLAAAVLTGRHTRAELWLKVKKAALRFWPVAAVAGWSFFGAQQLLLTMLNLGHWNADFFGLSKDGSGIDSIRHIHAVLGAGQQGFVYFALNIMLSLVISSLVIMIVGAIGEEGGWRGVLQPEMQRRFGPIKGTLFVGLIWGFWHLPINLGGLNDEQHPVFGALVIFPIAAISMSFVLAWLINRTASVWPGALAHGANNALSGCMIILPNGWLVDQWTATVVAALIGALFAWLLARDTRNDAGKPVTNVTTPIHASKTPLTRL
jgi:membrane protease YdiL (CAAX protease family)